VWLKYMGPLLTPHTPVKSSRLLHKLGTSKASP
jgi:hypothetical protein